MRRKRRNRRSGWDRRIKALQRRPQRPQSFGSWAYMGAAFFDFSRVACLRETIGTRLQNPKRDEEGESPTLPLYRRFFRITEILCLSTTSCADNPLLIPSVNAQRLTIVEGHFRKSIAIHQFQFFFVLFVTFCADFPGDLRLVYLLS
jgi:hypothetical protein